MENIVMSQLQFDLRSCTAFFANDVRFSKFYEKYHPEDIADAFFALLRQRESTLSTRRSIAGAGQGLGYG
jgi:hypothetical protein